MPSQSVWRALLQVDADRLTKGIASAEAAWADCRKQRPITISSIQTLVKIHAGLLRKDYERHEVGSSSSSSSAPGVHIDWANAHDHCDVDRPKSSPTWRHRRSAHTGAMQQVRGVHAGGSMS
jgi:hypothetical protein